MSAMNEATPSSTPTATKRPVGRPRKYEDDEQRLEAKRKSARESYHRRKNIKHCYIFRRDEHTFKTDDGSAEMYLAMRKLGYELDEIQSTRYTPL